MRTPNYELPLIIRIAAPAAALAVLLVLPVTDHVFGGNILSSPSPVYESVGDADGNGILDMQDVQVIRKAAFEQYYDSRLLPVADLNGDGKITSDDTGILLKYLSEPSAPDVPPDVYYQQLMQKKEAAQ